VPRSLPPVRLVWASGEQGDVFKPKLYLLAVGISAYQKSDLMLRMPPRTRRTLPGAVDFEGRSISGFGPFMLVWPILTGRYRVEGGTGKVTVSLLKGGSAAGEFMVTGAKNALDTPAATIVREADSRISSSH
jgi:hypothetical protein